MRTDMAQVYTDFSSLAALRAKARDDQDAALDQVSRQFESLFLQMMLKSMRDASFGGGLLDSKQTEFYRDMHDKQIAMDMSQKPGIGLADVLKRQLGSGVSAADAGLRPEDYINMPITSRPVRRPAANEAGRVSPGHDVDRSPSVDPAQLDGSPKRFIEAFWPAAQRVAAKLDIAPEALLAQAALETGWGRHVMRHADGGSSFNLFGIKADLRWRGDRVDVSTLEYRDGVALKTRAGFRAYGSFDESFDDYVTFVKGNPRYAEAVKVAQDPHAYFDALQQAGYATDPAYARKIQRILDGSAMQHAQRSNRGGSAAI